MHYGTLHPTQGFKGFSNKLSPCLNQHLNSYVVRDTIFSNQLSQKIEIMARGRGKSYLNRFKTNI